MMDIAMVAECYRKDASRLAPRERIKVVGRYCAHGSRVLLHMPIDVRKE